MLEIKSKKIFFFDIDNTILSTKHQQILPQTITLLKELSQNPDTVLSIATGRNKKRLDVLGEVLPLFKNFVLLNGAVSILNNQIIDENPFTKTDLAELIKIVKKNKMLMGVIGLEKEAVIEKKDLKILNFLKNFIVKKENILDETFHQYNDIYQIWVVDSDSEKIRNFMNNDKYSFYYWHRLGMDVVPKGINKIHGIKQIKAQYPEHQLICVGDGHNDIEMIKYADIGIAMNNSKYDVLKSSANIIAPDITENSMYHFFKKNNLI